MEAAASAATATTGQGEVFSARGLESGTCRPAHAAAQRGSFRCRMKHGNRCRLPRTRPCLMTGLPARRTQSARRGHTHLGRQLHPNRRACIFRAKRPCPLQGGSQRTERHLPHRRRNGRLPLSFRPCTPQTTGPRARQACGRTPVTLRQTGRSLPQIPVPRKQRAQAAALATVLHREDAKYAGTLIQPCLGERPPQTHTPTPTPGALARPTRPTAAQATAPSYPIAQSAKPVTV